MSKQLANRTQNGTATSLVRCQAVLCGNKCFFWLGYIYWIIDYHVQTIENIRVVDVNSRFNLFFLFCI